MSGRLVPPSSLAKPDSILAVYGARVAKGAAGRTQRVASPSSGRKDSDGRQVRNFILSTLPEKEWAQIDSSLEFVRLRLHQVLHETGETIKSGYFLNDGLGSVLTTEPNGKTVEVGLIGNEGFVGLPIIFGFKTSGLRVVTQADATAYRVDAATLLKILPQCPELGKHLQRFSMMLGMLSTQIAACNRLHGVVERLARWLLMSQDRVGSEILPLTQEFLAQMLGTRRASVTVAAGTLQSAGLIKGSRGSVTILNRKQLEKRACSCYDVIEQQKKKWRDELLSADG